MIIPVTGPGFDDYIAQIFGNVFCCGIVPLILLAYAGVLGGGSSGYRTLKRLPAQAEVIPVYYDHRAYEGYSEGGVTTARQLKRSVTDQVKKNLQGIPSAVPVRQAAPLKRSPDIAGFTPPAHQAGKGSWTPPPSPVPAQSRNTPLRQRTTESGAYEERHKQPEYMVDGTLIGYRYFTRDTDGNMKSVAFDYFPEGNWREGHNVANVKPAENNAYGLYAAYTPDSPYLDRYEEMLGENGIKAITAFEGDVAFGEYGFRAEEGDVVQILKEPPLKPGEKPLKWHSSKSRKGG